jgi:hypothetical protein
MRRATLRGNPRRRTTPIASRTERTTRCPYNGDASYFSVTAGGKALENSIWTYETPFPAMTEISGHLAFYHPDKVKIEESKAVVAGLDPAIHPLRKILVKNDGCAGQARA